MWWGGAMVNCYDARRALPADSLTIGRVSGSVVVTLRGSFDQLAESVVAQLVSDLVVDQGNLSVVVDLLESRDGGFHLVRALTEAEVALAERGGRLLAVDPPGPVCDSLWDADLAHTVTYTTRIPGCGPELSRRALARLVGLADHPSFASADAPEPGHEGRALASGLSARGAGGRV